MRCFPRALFLFAALTLPGVVACDREAPAPDASTSVGEGAEATSRGSSDEEQAQRQEPPPTLEPVKKGERGQGSEALGVAGAARLGGVGERDEAAEALRRKLGPRAVRSMQWGSEGRLWVGFQDGQLASLDVHSQEGELRAASARPAPVVSVSPTGRVALLESTPPRLVAPQAGQDILTWSEQEELGAVAFDPSGEAMFLSAPKGPMRIWKEIGKMEGGLDEEVRLEDYVFRLQGDLQVDFGPMADSLVAAEGPTLAYVEPNGQIVWWDMRRPSEALYVLRLEPPVTSVALAGGHLVATSADGQMRVSVIEERNMRRWSMDQQAERVAADPGHGDSFVALRGDELVRLSTEQGEELWGVEVPGASTPSCGLAVSQEHDVVALCRGDRISFWEFESGEPIARVRRTAKGLGWDG